MRYDSGRAATGMIPSARPSRGLRESLAYAGL